jgi:hypothetical protein
MDIWGTFRPKGQAVTSDLRNILHNNELHGFYYSPNINIIEES